MALSRLQLIWLRMTRIITIIAIIHCPSLFFRTNIRKWSRAKHSMFIVLPALIDIVQLKHDSIVAQESHFCGSEKWRNIHEINAAKYFFCHNNQEGTFVSIIQHIIFERFIWCPSKCHEMKVLLPVTSAKIWPGSGMLTVNITITRGIKLLSHFEPGSSELWLDFPKSCN